jgi:kumamolisin
MMHDEQQGAANRRQLTGSERPRPQSHRLIGPVDANERVAATLVIRRKPGSPPLPDLNYWQKTPLREQRVLSTAEYTEKYGANRDDLAKVQGFFAARGMSVRDSHAGRRTMTVEGTAAQINEVFGVALNHYEAPVRERRSHRSAKVSGEEPARTQRHRGFDGAVHLPAEISELVTAVVGLDNRSGGGPAGGPSGDPPNSKSLAVPQIAAFYNFPNQQVSDQTVGVIAPSDPPTVSSPRLSGYLESDLTKHYFPGLQTNFPDYATAPASFNDIGLTVGSNTYSNSTASATAENNFSQEVTQDISTSATIAQGCTMNVYFTELTENGLLVCLNRILIPETEKQPTVVTCSFSFFSEDSGLGSATD